MVLNNFFFSAEEPIVLRVNESTRTIANPRNPAMCGSQKQCIWIIHAKEELNVRLVFELFDIPSCSGSYVEVRSGTSSAGHLVGTFCGNNKPPKDICSNGNHLWIKYKYNSSRDLRRNLFTLTSRQARCGSQNEDKFFTEPIDSGELYMRMVPNFIT